MRMTTKVYIGGLAPDVTGDELVALFEQFGEVLIVTLPTHARTGQPLGYGHVDMRDAAGAEAAVAGLNGTEFRGRLLNANLLPASGRRPSPFH
ncbi:RNA recognition motif. (a.k.a. RRM, RBD, or RNP domain) [Pseudacidovorax sp. RU35E]|nr:RNA recognition motif. (a.k.a. RRM, RBD, or RNP domain) [Pseudacidovorax sp. RU35E]